MAMVESRLRTGGGGQDMGEEAILSLSFSDQLGYGSLVKREKSEIRVFVFLDSIVSLSLSVFYFIDFLVTLFFSLAFSRVDLTSVCWQR